MIARSNPETSMEELTNDKLTGGVVSARSGVQPAASYSGGGQTKLGAGLFASRDHSHVLDQLSEAMSGE